MEEPISEGAVWETEPTRHRDRGRKSPTNQRRFLEKRNAPSRRSDGSIGRASAR
jgi:hypothetical protein